VLGKKSLQVAPDILLSPHNGGLFSALGGHWRLLGALGQGGKRIFAAASGRAANRRRRKEADLAKGGLGRRGAPPLLDEKGRRNPKLESGFTKAPEAAKTYINRFDLKRFARKQAYRFFIYHGFQKE
jgi:hypothetical protein